MPRESKQKPKARSTSNTGSLPTTTDNPHVAAYRHKAKRKNLPPAGLAAQGKVREAPKIEFAYNPHRPPVLRFDESGAADKLPELLKLARTRALTKEEAELLSDMLRTYEPWLEWSGKREKKSFTVDPVALHIHERVSAQAILQIAARENPQRSLFGDPELGYRETIQFYQHDVDWTNRMILGDSLQVMASLAQRENLAGKVQMIYVDPPYGIKFGSNFQPEIGRRDVRDRDADLTREPEMVKAYRDTWTLGVHSYLAYLRDRLVLAKELLTDSGSVFVQISDENTHRVRSVLDDVFGAENFCSEIAFRKTSGIASDLLASSKDWLLWYTKDIDQIKFNRIYKTKIVGEPGAEQFDWFEEPNGTFRKANESEIDLGLSDDQKGRLFAHNDPTAVGHASTTYFTMSYAGKEFRIPNNRRWRTPREGMDRLARAERLLIIGDSLRYKRYLSDHPVYAVTDWWEDTGISGFGDKKMYVVQTASKVIERCMLMTTDPGDLVLDPTCGSGTTAYIAEQWGRRWITIDTSRVALALARQRLLTSTYPFYRTKEGNGSPAQGFVSRTVPHITLKSIAQNVALDSIFDKHQPAIEARLAALNHALKSASPQLRQQLLTKLQYKEKHEGKKSITDADRRRWVLPKQEWREWEVPFEADEDWTQELKTALAEYRSAWRAKMDEVNSAIEANAEQEELVDDPEKIDGVVRVSGPFTMEAVMPLEESLSSESPIADENEELETFGEEENFLSSSVTSNEPTNAEAFQDKMLRLLRADGVRFPNNNVLRFNRLEPFHGEFIHAEGEWESDGQAHHVAVSFGPEFGPITSYQVENALRIANRRGFDDLVLAGFSFDAEAQAIVEDDPNPTVRAHLAHIRPDVNMGDLLKETPNSQLFTVFGSPRTELYKTSEGLFEIEMQGVDIYNPVDNTIMPTGADKVAAWFLDSDYDGRTFCITQAFFPDKNAWEKLARALKSVMDEDRFAAFSGTVSLPFAAGKYKRAAVKVIDPRGNEVMRVHRLEDAEAQYGKR